MGTRDSAGQDELLITSGWSGSTGITPGGSFSFPAACRGLLDESVHFGDVTTAC